MRSLFTAGRFMSRSAIWQVPLVIDILRRCSLSVAIVVPLANSLLRGAREFAHELS